MTLLALLLGPVTCAMSSARADAPNAETAEAHRRFQLGVQHFQAGRYAEALGNFEHAYRLKPNPLVRVNIANCYDKLRRPVEALEAFEAFLETQEGSEPQRREVEQAVDRLSKQLGRLVLRALPASALTQVDAETEPRPGARWLTPGPHHISVSAQGYASSVRDVEMRAGEVEVLHVTLAPNHEALGPASILLGEAGQPLESRPPSRGRRNGTALWIGAGATLLFGVTALVTGELALAANREFATDLRAVRNPQLTERQRAGAWSHGVDASDRAESLAATTDVLLGLTLVSAGVTTYLWLSGRDSEQSPAASRVQAGVSLGRVHLDAQF